jgi:glutaredoxin
MLRLKRLFAAALFAVLGAATTVAPLADAHPEELACNDITVFVAVGCPHCAAAEEYLAKLAEREPELVVRLREVTRDKVARAAFIELNTQHDIRHPGVPTFSICGSVIVGFNEAAVRQRLYSADPVHDAPEIDLPIFGRLDPAAVGLPVFTIAIGLVDGFNPCAMWVLLFLLSILVNVKSRGRILMVAGTFVAVSGIVYFAFMAAWLNAFLVFGFSRSLQVVLGALALVVGSVHVKDFFALHRGITLSIPESVKPGFYQRVRRIVRAENLPVALGGTIVIAVLVNFIEFLCTAGLPALYTQILTYHDLRPAGYYGYLALYNLAYIADDSVMVALAVVTLGRRRLQEREGRWLKLLSGGFIIVLGSLLLFAPGSLVF